MSDVPDLDAAGLPEELSPFDQILHRGEANPRTRSGIMTLEILDSTPEWDRFRARFENASRKVLRLRQKVVIPTLPTAAPRWVVDPDFNLDFHVRRLRIPEPGTLRQLIDLAEVAAQSPLDISRPLWTVTLVEGLADGQAAVMMHLSHAVTDGVGAVEMFANIYDLERDPPKQDVAPLPIPQDLSPNDLMRQGFNRLPSSILGRGPRRAVRSGTCRRRNDPRSDLQTGRSCRIRNVRCTRRRPCGPTVAGAAPSQPVVTQRGDRYRVRRPAQGGQGSRRLDQRRLPGGSVRGPAPLPRSQRGADRCAADGGSGQPALGGRPRRRQPIRRRQSRRSDQPDRSRSAHQEHPLPDDPKA